MHSFAAPSAVANNPVGRLLRKQWAMSCIVFDISCCCLLFGAAIAITPDSEVGGTFDALLEIALHQDFQAVARGAASRRHGWPMPCQD